MDYKIFLEESAEELYEKSPCGYLSFLCDGTIVKVNQTLLNWLGLTREEILCSKKLIDLLNSTSQEYYLNQVRPLLQNQGFVNDVQVELIDFQGLPVPALLNITQIKDQNEITQINRASILNLTQQKKHEQELLAAKKQAEEENKVKTEFISTLTHEIRTPLNAIIGVTDLLIKNKTPEQTAEFLEVLKYASDSLLNLINDILDLSKMEAGRTILNQRPFNLRQVVRQTGVTQQIKAAAKGISVQVILDEKLPAWLVGDEIKIGQVLTNLVSNAVKFTQKGWVRLQLEVISVEKDFYQICFRVIDTGIGIPPERIDTIFEEFAQATTDTSLKFGGTGLGLTISKRILDLYGSKIKVTSKPGEGTEFSFILKLRKSDPVAATKTNSPLIGKEDNLLKGVKLLLVEDSKVNSMVVEQYLKNWGVEFVLARNGLQAISKITQSDFDLILMDLQMPVLNGYEATRWIRALPEIKYQKLPIIAISAEVKTETGPTTGLTDYLIKPFKPDELFAKIALHSRRKG